MLDYITTGKICLGNYYEKKYLTSFKWETSDLKNTGIKEITEVFVDKRYAGKTVGEMEETQQITIFLVLRDDLSVLPQKNTILKLNDIIIIREPDL